MAAKTADFKWIYGGQVVDLQQPYGGQVADLQRPYGGQDANTQDTCGGQAVVDHREKISNCLLFPSHAALTCIFRNEK